jgi:hypothetical protein
MNLALVCVWRLPSLHTENKRMKVTRTKAWKKAEWEYTEMHAQSIVPFIGLPLSRAEIVERLERIIEICPKFYPTLVEIGLNRLAAGGNAEATRKLAEGFTLMLELAEPGELLEELDGLIENLEMFWRFDLSKHYLEILIERYPERALFQDGLALATVRMGDIDAALLHVAKAVEMEPDNSRFLSNLGWINLIAGNVKDAGEALAEARRLDPDDEVVTGNLCVHRYLIKHGGNYFDYLLRPLEREEIDRLADEEEWKEVDRICASYNQERVEAMAQALFLENDQKRQGLAELLSTLRLFLAFVDKLDPSGYFLYEDLSFIQTHFKSIMHKFNVKFDDVDDEMVGQVYEALIQFYGFLAARGLVLTREFKSFKKTLLSMTNVVRYRNDMNEEVDASQGKADRGK